MSIEIIPAILPNDYDEIIEKVSMVKKSAKTVQIDICDGKFVPNTTWPFINNDGDFERIQKEEEGMPAWQEVDYEFDLMIDEPDRAVDQWVAAGAARIILHAEAKGGIGKAIEYLKGRVEVGMALNIDTPISIIGETKFGIEEGSLQFIQLMGIDRVGFQGQEFDPKVIEKIKAIKKMCPDYPVSIDGGVSFENARRLTDAGADRLVVGSAIFDSENVMETIKQFQSL